MKRAGLWFILSLKQQARRWLFWATACMFLLILWMISAVSLPGGTNWEVLLWNEDGQGGAELVQQLEETESAYHFTEASGREQLLHDVEVGKAECGFIIEKGFSDQAEAGFPGVLTERSRGKSDGGAADKSLQGTDEIAAGQEHQRGGLDSNGLITYVNSSFTTKGSGAKETVFAVIYRKLAGELMVEESPVIFGASGRDLSEYDGNEQGNEDADVAGEGEAAGVAGENEAADGAGDSGAAEGSGSNDALKRSLLEKYNRYLNSDEVFRVDYRPIASAGDLATAVVDASAAGRQPVRALAMILIFLDLLLAGGAHRQREGNGPEAAMAGADKVLWEFTSNLAAVSVPFLVSFAAVRILETNRIPLWREILCFLLMVVLADFWVIGFGRLFRTRLSYTCWVFTILLCEMILCPIFWNPGSYLPVLPVIGCIFPPGIALLLA